MSNNNIFTDAEYRKKFLRNADYKSLNECLKYMDKLSKKHEKYKLIYNESLDYLLNFNDKRMQTGGNNIMNFLLGKPADNSLNTMSEQKVYDTEAYINKINNITQQTINCDTKLNELIAIRNVLENDNNYISTGNDWVKATRKFIDIVLSCGILYTKSEYETFRTVHFKELSKLIISNKKFLKEAFYYLNKVLQNEKSKLSEEFMKKYSDMRLIKPTKIKDEYKKIKENMIKDHITKLGPNGFEIVCTSKFVEKVLNAYKLLSQKTS